MTRQRTDARLALLRAAERLFAARGVDVVSLREIAGAAGQGNHSAALYHFADKKDLINSLLERHSDPIQSAWLLTLNHMAAEGRVAAVLYCSIADYHRLVTAGHTLPREDFTQDLIASLVSLLGTKTRAARQEVG